MAVIDRQLPQESRDRYLTYALSVVSGRALPDVRDGLKPVQRRILFAMFNNLNLTPSHSHRKSAAVVGEVLARFHPHGDTACYEAMVRMAQDFSLRYPLVDGQGNFGSLDGDNAAAYRYTEARLLPLAIEVIGEIDQETVDYRDNFDGTVTEPIVLPSRIPNLLVNGATGIAVGMATSIPPHNLRDVCKALIELSQDPEMSNSKLTTIIKGPDFPTGCQILNSRKELDDIYATGRGMIRMRGDWEVEEEARGKKNIIITSIPYAVNKSQLVEKIAGLIVDKKVPQLVDIRDESTDKVRVVIELASGAEAEVAMAYLYKHTPVESGFPVNLTALIPGSTGACVPQLLTLKDCLREFLTFRQTVVQRRLEFEKRTLEARIHILEGLVKIYDALDEALKIVRKSEGRTDAAEKLKARFKLTDIQAFAVVDMRIYQLSKTNIDEIRAELEAKLKRIDEIVKILKSKAKMLEIVRKDLELVSETYGDNRRCKMVKESAEIEFREEDYVVQEDVYAIITSDGWLKRVRQTNELASTRLREGDQILKALPLSTLDSVVFFTNLGSLFALRVADFPSSSGYGDPVQKILKFKDGETIVACFGMKASEGKQGELAVPGSDLIKENDVMTLVSKNGVGFALKVTGLEAVKRNGKRALKLRDGDFLAAVAPHDKKLALFTQRGSGLVIDGKEIPVRDSAAIGVSLIGVRDEDRLVSAISFNTSAKLLLTFDSGKTSDLASSEVLAGHRALKGNKVISRGEIKMVQRA
ncbi:MAG: DNA topoisomerase IV subunit A [Deltaproteobacteria bacterium]|nr:DNA topoisomerase IV subunit A [Deltaproteobacteria bacterium]